MFEERKVVTNINEEDKEKAVVVEEEAIVVDATHNPEDDLPITMLNKVVSPLERAHGSRKETEDGKRKVELTFIIVRISRPIFVMQISMG